ncbi:MAG: hypothetical protein M4579_002234 [Chaenotheca gracillima]|nr:MAG: hypothetical protein M4579_002234 [Chaenotheca gracillima]
MPRSSSPPLPSEIETVFRRIKNLGNDRVLRGSNNAGIYLVRRRDTGKKYIEKTFTANQIRLREHRSEITLLKSCKHKNITKFIAAWRVDEASAHLIAEYCRHGTLYDLHLKYKDAGLFIPESFARKAMEDLVSGLAYLHWGLKEWTPDRGNVTNRQRGWRSIAHRDLNMCNIFLQRGKGMYPRLVIGDFGSACGDDDRNWDHGPRAIAHAVIPPEYPRMKHSADVWAVGCAMQILCRQDDGPFLPIPGNLNTRVWVRHPMAYEIRGAGQKYSKGLRECVDMCLTFKYAQRLASDHILGHIMDIANYSNVEKVPLLENVYPTR